MDDISDPSSSPTPPGQPRQRSDAVTAVAVVNFALGGLQLLCGSCIAVGGGALAAILGFAAQQDRDLAPEEAEQLEQFVQIGGGVIVVFGVFYILLAVLLFVAGYGVTKRQNWGRTLTLALGVIAFPLAIPALVVGEWFGGLANLGYAIFVFAVLLNRRYRAEFN